MFFNVTIHGHRENKKKQLSQIVAGQERTSAQHKLYVCSFDHAQIKVASHSFRLSSHLFFPVQTASLISPFVLPSVVFYRCR